MGQTIAEKILAAHCGSSSIRPGQVVLADIDYVIGTDTKIPLAIRVFEEMRGSRVANPDRIEIALDHYSLPCSSIPANEHRLVRQFAAGQSLVCYDPGCGIGHQLALESGRILPGTLVAATDSHASIGGALNCLELAIGSAEMAAVMLTGQLWFRVPESKKITLTGRMPEAVYGKDIGLEVIRRIGPDGANYEVLEVDGEGLESLDISDRLSMSSLSIETGAKSMVMAFDDRLDSWLRGRGYDRGTPVASDSDAVFTEEITIDLSELGPVLAAPPDVDNVIGIGEAEGLPVNTVFIGSCTNGRLEDLRQAAMILKGRKAAPGVKLLVAPASREVYVMAVREGIVETLLEAGATLLTVGCGSCIGAMGNGIPADGDRVVSTANRNLKGRMANDKAEVFLASAATAAASALEGRIADPRHYTGRLARGKLA